MFTHYTNFTCQSWAKGYKGLAAQGKQVHTWQVPLVETWFKARGTHTIELTHHWLPLTAIGTYVSTLQPY